MGFEMVNDVFMRCEWDFPGISVGIFIGSFMVC